MKLPQPFLDLPLAHRGLHDASVGVFENTLSACVAASKAGYGVEIDVQMSADGEAVVFHDASLVRMTAAQGNVCEKTTEELAGIRVGDSEDTILPLAEVLSHLPADCPVLIELKDQSGDFSEDGCNLPAAVARAVQGSPGYRAVMSFNPHYIAEISRSAPEIPLGLVTEDFRYQLRLPARKRRELSNISAFESSGSSFVSHDRHNLSSRAIARLKSAGVPILCWTVRSKRQETAARRVADNITFEGYKPKLPAPAA